MNHGVTHAKTLTSYKSRKLIVTILNNVISIHSCIVM